MPCRKTRLAGSISKTFQVTIFRPQQNSVFRMWLGSLGGLRTCNERAQVFVISYRNLSVGLPNAMIWLNGRGKRIRTSGLYVPNVALYRAELYPDLCRVVSAA